VKHCMTSSIGPNSLAAGFVLVVVTLGCGGKVDNESDGLYEKGRAVIPAAEDVVELQCRPVWRACEQDLQCCYGPCWDEENQRPGVGECIGCLPPGHACRYSTDCCGRCSRECDVRDLDCQGVCLLALPGDWCRRDEECLAATCVSMHCERSP
jgi:hypothetical protein